MKFLITIAFLLGLTAVSHCFSSDDLESIRKSAEQGNAEAQVLLSRFYYKGEGVPKDYKEAFTWYRKSAEQGDAEVQYSLGVRYYNG